jgi:hypothetical protein
MTTIYKNLTGEIDCPLKGDHWIKIGFQGSDPRTDLRATGIFSMMQFLAFIDKFPLYAKEIYNHSYEADSRFPLACIFINFTFYSIQALREGILIPYCNNRISVINVINDYYFGMIDYFFTNFKSANHIVHNTIERVNTYSKKNLDKIFLRTNLLNQKFPQLSKDSMSLGEENNNY